MNLALFADVSNLYYCIGKRFDNGKLDYAKLYEKAAKLGNLQRAFAYGSQVNDEAATFITCLKKIGYDTKWKKPRMSDHDEKKIVRKADWDVGITVDIVRQVQRVDGIILCTADADLVPLVQWVRDQGVRCIVFACGISRELKEAADQYIEIGSDMLEERRPVPA